VLADFQLPYLRELKFYGSPCLTADDYILLHWLNTSVSIPHIESFSFIGDIRFANRPSKAHPVSENDSYILEDFLIAHRASLQHLSLSGVFLPSYKIQLPYDLHAPETNFSRQLQSLSISLDVPNLEMLLIGTRHLETLRWDKYQYFEDTVPQNFSLLLSCIQENWNCLRSIEITPVIVSKNISEEMLQILTIDCEIFEECYSLQIIRLRLNFMTDPENYSNSVPGRVRNIHLLPTGLELIEIWADGYDRIDLELCESRFEEYKYLHTFYLTCPPENAYVVPSSWIRRIQRMNLTVAIFIGGTLKNMADAKRFLRGNSRSRTCLTSAEDNRIVLQWK
jgi:hypothetical protein